MAAASNPERWRRRFIAWALFAGCKSGIILKKVFGEAVSSFIWEEASRQIGSHSAATFSADLDHLRSVLAAEVPDVTIAFGLVAGEALRKLVPPERLILAPHPAARGGDTLRRLHEARRQLEKL